jgi:hypothetical protein
MFRKLDLFSSSGEGGGEDTYKTPEEGGRPQLEAAAKQRQ